jgi:hypothetical protein
MKTIRPLLASLVTLLAVCLAHAADSKPIARVMTILDVETDDPTGYATWLKEYNEIAKGKTGVDHLLRVFQTVFDGRRTGNVRVAVSAASVTELTKVMAAVEADPAIARNVEHLRAIRRMGARALYQAVRFEGASPRGAHNYVTFANVTDEPGYLAALDELRGIFDGAGLKDVKIAAYRTIAGRHDQRAQRRAAGGVHGCGGDASQAPRLARALGEVPHRRGQHDLARDHEILSQPQAAGLVRPRYSIR